MCVAAAVIHNNTKSNSEMSKKKSLLFLGGLFFIVIHFYSVNYLLLCAGSHIYMGISWERAIKPRSSPSWVFWKPTTATGLVLRLTSSNPLDPLFVIYLFPKKEKVNRETMWAGGFLQKKKKKVCRPTVAVFYYLICLYAETLMNGRRKWIFKSHCRSSRASRRRRRYIDAGSVCVCVVYE